MDYKIYTLAEDIKIEKTSSLIATVGDIREEKEADTHWVNIFINDNSDIGYSFIDQVELFAKDDIKTQEELLVFTMNWYFENVQVVTEKQNKINIQKAIEYRENLEYEKAIEDLSKYTEESSIVLKDELYKALNIEADENAMQEAVDKAILKLDEAIKSLVEKIIEPDVDDEIEDDDSIGDSSKDEEDDKDQNPVIEDTKKKSYYK